LWLCSWVPWARIGSSKIKAGGKDHIPHVRSALLDGLVPSAYPVGVPVEDGRIFTPVDNLNAFWALYAPTTEENSRGLMAEDLFGPGLGRALRSGRRYLRKGDCGQARALPLPAPVRAGVVPEHLQPRGWGGDRRCLLALQQKREHADLRYDIRLFTSDPDSPVLGEALESMVRPGAR
jgi:DNA phosphorothioation-dependent restriction protein DptH